MKINKLHLKAFGPFTDTTLDFSTKGHGLHVVLGANEAGKSSALRALTGLLYGFGHRVGDAWLHANKDLAVGGEFLLPDDTLLSLTRYKRRKNDLIDNTTDKPFNQADLDAHLGRMGRKAFEHTFAISHESLRLGIESVLAAGGDLGQALFAATSGLNTLKRVMTRLEEEQSKLFAPRATKTRINATLSQIKGLRKQQGAASASHRQWKVLKKKVDELYRQEKMTDEGLKELSTKFNLISRHEAALPHVAKWKELSEKLKKIGFVPDLSEDFSSNRVETQIGQEQAKSTLVSLKENTEMLKQKLCELLFDQNILSHEKLIESLSAEANIHSKAKTDSKSLRARIYQQREAAQKALSRLHSDQTLDSVEALRLSQIEHSNLQRLGAKGIKLQEAANSAEKSLRTAVANLKRHESELSEMETLVQREALAASLSRAAEHGKLHERMKMAQHEESLLRHQANTTLAALGLWKGTLTELQSLPLPSIETMHIFESELTDLNRSLEDAKEKHAILSTKLDAKEKHLAEMTRMKDLPSLEDLKQHRFLRDKGWQSVKSVWLHKGQVVPDFINHFPDHPELVSAFEYSMKQADTTSDILREDAESVTQAEALRTDILEFRDELTKLETHQNQLHEAQEDHLTRWEDTWKPLAITPLSPREMIAWSRNVLDLKGIAVSFRKAESLTRQLEEDSEEISSDLQASLAAINVSVPATTPYTNLLDLAGRTLADLDADHEKRKDISTRITASSKEIRIHQERTQEIEQKYNGWCTAWTKAVANLGFLPNATTEEVQEFVLTVEDICNQLDKCKELQIRNSAIESDYKEFTLRVSEAVHKLAPALGNLAPETAALSLNARLTKEKDAYKESRLLESENRKIMNSTTTAAGQLAALDKKMKLLCAEAGTNAPDKLPIIEKQYQIKSKLLHELEKITERLEELASGQDLPIFIDQVKAANPDELKTRLDRLAAQKKSLQGEQKRLVADLALARKDLESLDGETGALEIAEKAEGLIGKTQSEVKHFVKLKIAAAILKQSIERYRQSNQSPVLEAASTYFQTITRDSFVGLQADYDDKGNPVIKAKRKDASLLTVGELSDGSRDQLFLALRLGGLSKYVVNNGAMPFVVDDVLVHFDDARSIAALEAMIKLAQKTQVIFFTHHAHLIELLEKTGLNDATYLHHLLPNSLN